MGAFQIWHIEFKDRKSKKYFESLKIHQKILCSYFDWEIGKGEVTYNVGWDGYGKGACFLKEHYKKLNIKKFYSLDLSCRTNWYNELKEFKK